jgi:ankyrin repeat protein
MCFKHYDIAKYLIDAGADINIVNKDLETILSGAVDYNLIDFVELLCKKGIYINLVNNQSYTPIFLAIANNHHEIVKILIKYGANLEIKEKVFGDTPLMASMKFKNNAKLLIESGANIHVENNIEDTPVSIAALLDQLEIVKILKEKGADLNRQNTQRNNPIIFAVGNGYIEMVKYLLECNVDLYVIDICKESLLNICIYQDRLEIMDLLLKKDKNLPNKKFYTCRWSLFIAVKRNKLYFAELLLKHGANPNPENLLENSPLFMAFENKNYKIIELLIKYGVSKLHLMNCYIHFHKYHELVYLINTNRYLLNEYDGNFRNALFNAVYANDVSIAKFLLEKGSNPNIYGSFNSPLKIAILVQNLEMIELLIKYGADIGNKNYEYDYNESIFHCAKRTFNKKIIKFFENLGL